MSTVFLRVLEADDKARAMLEVIRDAKAYRDHRLFAVSPRDFSALPGFPFAYWLSDHLRKFFLDLPPFETDGRTAKTGLQTSDDFRFVRSWWETQSAGLYRRWSPFAKGGRFSPFYADVYLVVNWHEGGREVHEFNGVPLGTAGAPVRNPTYYFRPGLTWPLRARRFAPQALPARSIFSIRAYCVFAPVDQLAFTLATLNSSVFDYLFKTSLGRYGFPEFVVGVLQHLPWQAPRSDGERCALAALSRRAWLLRRSLDTRVETSHAFTQPALLQVGGDTFATRAAAWAEHVTSIDAELSSIQAEIDDLCFDLYGIDEPDRRVISEGVGRGADEPGHHIDTDTDADMEADDEGEAEGDADAANLAAELVSWTVA